MSYDVTVFDPAMAPAGADDYVEWIEGLSGGDPADPGSELAAGFAALLARLKADVTGFADYADCTVVGPTLRMSFPFDHAGDVMPVLMDLIIAAGYGLEVESEGIMIRDPEALLEFSRLGIKGVGVIDGLVFLD